MIFGFFQVYNEKDWISYQIDQSMKLCDKMLIIEGSQFAGHPHISERSNDGTLDIIHEKIKQYPSRILLEYTTRKHNNYRKNQSDNFNRALSKCAVGDYFIPIDADELHHEFSIKLLRELMNENKIDVIKFYGYVFAFSFNWRLLIKNEDRKEGLIFKKNKDMFFTPTHNHHNTGTNIRIIDDKLLFNHYKWVKPTERMRIRHETSNYVPGMLRWFDTSWENIILKDGAIYNFYLGNFQLKRYTGQHPKILDKHPWRRVEDVRNI